MKFTFTGYIKISATLSKYKDCIKISVEDTGVGIEKKNLRKLFSMFSKIARTQAINKSGVGLGLMISYNYSRFLTFEGGPGIQVESEVDEGSLFYFFIENKAKYLV